MLCDRGTDDELSRQLGLTPFSFGFKTPSWMVTPARWREMVEHGYEWRSYKLFATTPPGKIGAGRVPGVGVGIAFGGWGPATQPASSLAVSTRTAH
jgi:hypothetical protein